jgi:gamma-glutamyltranspeptidase/glutathione hydrolase
MTQHRPTIASRHGMVAAAQPLAAAAGARMLAQGGTAFDAAAAVGAMLNVVEPFMSGLGGLGLATMWVAAEQRVRVLDFITPVPDSFPAGRFTARRDLERGALSVATPGNLAGWCALARSHGRLKLTEIFAPAVAVAEDGFALLEFGALEFGEQAVAMAAYPALFPAWSDAYGAHGAGPRVGSVIRQPDLARTLAGIAAEGPELLYQGELGATVIAHLQSLGGTLTRADLAAVRPVWQAPATARYRGLEVNLPPPPCEGFQILLALRMLEAFALGVMPHNGLDHLDTVLRAIRLAAGLRIAHNNPSPALLAELLSDAAIARAVRRISDGTPIEGPTEQWVAPPVEAALALNTTSFSIADREGNVVCVTQSLGSPFGSGVVVPGTGVCLNNFLYWADVQPGSPNRAVAGAALPICMAPSITLRNGTPVLALGTPGSYGILQTQVQAMVQHIDFGLAPQKAIEAPRARLMDGRAVFLEDRIDAAVIDGLRARGHDAAAFGTDWTMKVGGMQAVALDPASGVMTGAADPRRDGHVAVP